MTGPRRPTAAGAARRAWSPEQGSRRIPCPACSAANDQTARVCRNCGLPLASAGDPLRGVAPGRVELLGTQRSGFSASVGLALVVGLLLISGTLAVSGGGILNSGGRIGVASEESPAPSQDGQGELPGSSPGLVGPAQVATPRPRTSIGKAFDYTCGDDAIRDQSSSRWRIQKFLVGPRDGFDRVTWEMRRQGKAEQGTLVRMEWLEPREARERFDGIGRVVGDRAVVITHEGPMQIGVNQRVDGLFLEPEGVEQIRSIEMFGSEDGLVRTVIGLAGTGCVKMSGKGLGKNAKSKGGRFFFDVAKP